MSRLSLVRSLLSRNNLHCFYIGSEDAHQSEYVAARDKRREFVSGFTGSAGTALVLEKEAYLWTDARYHLQASKQLSEEWTLMKQGQPNVPTITAFVAAFPEKCRIGVDAQLISLASYRSLLSAIGNRELVCVENLVDEVWNSPEFNRPQYAAELVHNHDVKYAGVDVSLKLDNIRNTLRSLDCSAHVVTALDSIAWLMNLRGSDISYNPVFRSYAVVTLDESLLFCDNKFSDEAVKSLQAAKVTVKPYDAVWEYLKTLVGNVLLDPECSLAIFNALQSVKLVERASPIVLSKATKNESEISGMRESHKRDGAAMCIFLSWLTDVLNAGEIVTEVTAADKLEEIRSKQDYFAGLSFETIAGFGSNGAIIHYKAETQSCKTLSKNDMFLLDSGAQYRDGGTTDITRTLHFGTPTDWQKTCFTRVLKGHINLAMAEFPAGTTGPTLDVIARLPLWAGGLDYRHGTGHGVGSFLNVHEGPHGIGATVRRPEMMLTALQEGMCVSNEPGYYEAGNFGVRIESVMTVKNLNKAETFENVKFLGFETLTCVPYQKSLIDVSLLTEPERNWINNFHAYSCKTLSPYLIDQKQERALLWLQESTKPL